MTAQEANLILVAVPVGEAHAEGWRTIWRRIDCWSPITLRNKLHDMHRDGLIERRAVPIPNGQKFLYWRERVAKACVPRDLMMAG